MQYIIVVSNATDYIGLLTTINCSANSNILLKQISKQFVVCCHYLKSVPKTSHWKEKNET